jgi:hypothetical protein
LAKRGYVGTVWKTNRVHDSSQRIGNALVIGALIGRF